jgi:hypothetical protein
MPTNLQNLTDETRDELAALALKLSGNTKTRKGFLGLVKEAAPETPIPEIDEVNAVQAKIDEERAAREKFENEQRDRWLQQDLSARKNAVAEKYGFSDDDMKKVEERMGKKELPADYEWAARLHKQEVEVSTPTNYGSGGHGPLDLEHNAKGLEGLMDDTDNWASRTAHQMIDEMHRKGKAPAF